MRILLFCNWKGSWPYIPEFQERLVAHGCTADVLDITTSKLICSTGQTISFETPIVSFFRFTPKLRHLVRYLAFNAWSRKTCHRYDILNIHYVDPMYIFCLKGMQTVARSLVASIWGSDFYRANDRARMELPPIFEVCDALTFINPRTRNDFHTYYGPRIRGRMPRSEVIRFGLQSIERIAFLRETESRSITRKALGIPEDAIVVTCGYNASPAQQHEKLADILSKAELPSQVMALFPMTYGGTSDYISSIEKILRKKNIRFMLFDKMMGETDTARLRLATDIVLNIQTTDQLSASIQEHLYAENIVIAGDWLPYELYDHLGVDLFRVPMNVIGSRLHESLALVGKHLPRFASNVPILGKFSSWNSNIRFWLDFYSNLLK